MANNCLIGQTFSCVPGQFGLGITSLFIFTRWFLLLNLFLCILWSALVILPQAVHYDYGQISDVFYMRNLVDGQVGGCCDTGDVMSGSNIGNIVLNLLSVYALLAYAPFLINRIHNYCNLISVEQRKCRHLVLNSRHHFSVILH